MADLVEILRTTSTPEARLVEAVLRDHDLNPVVLSADLANMLGVASMVVPVRILVPPDQEDEARTALAVIQAMANETPQDDPSECAACGAEWEPGFDVCWQCQAERPA